MGGVTAIIIGGFTDYSPYTMAIMIAVGFAASASCYTLWRLLEAKQAA